MSPHFFIFYHCPICGEKYRYLEILETLGDQKSEFDKFRDISSLFDNYRTILIRQNSQCVAKIANEYVPY